MTKKCVFGTRRIGRLLIVASLLSTTGLFVSAQLSRAGEPCQSSEDCLEYWEKCEPRMAGSYHPEDR